MQLRRKALAVLAGLSTVVALGTAPPAQAAHPSDPLAQLLSPTVEDPLIGMLAALPTPYRPYTGPICASGDPQCIVDVITEMEDRLAPEAAACDHDAIFGLAYLRVTQNVKAAADNGYFTDRSWLTQIDAVFAHMYSEPWTPGTLAGDEVPHAWQTALRASDDKSMSGLGDFMLNMNAHINNDFPYALEKVGLTAADGSSHKPDHNAYNDRLDELYLPVFEEEAARFDPTFNNFDPARSTSSGGRGDHARLAGDGLAAGGGAGRHPRQPGAAGRGGEGHRGVRRDPGPVHQAHPDLPGRVLARPRSLVRDAPRLRPQAASQRLGKVDRLASGVTRPLTTAVQIKGDEGHPHGDHSDPETGCTDAGDEQDCTNEHQGYGDPYQRLPHSEHLPTWTRTTSAIVMLTRCGPPEAFVLGARSCCLRASAHRPDECACSRRFWRDGVAHSFASPREPRPRSFATGARSPLSEDLYRPRTGGAPGVCGTTRAAWT